MSNGKDVFNRLAEDWNLPGSQTLVRFLEISITPEEGELLHALTWWMSPQQLAQKLNITEDAITPILQGLMKRGWLRFRKGLYNAGPNMLSTMPTSALPGVSGEKLDAVWTGFYRSGDYQRWSVDAWIIRLAATGYAVHRIAPARKALKASPNLKPDQILWYEDIEQALRKARVIHGGRGKDACGCRKVWGVCDSPVGCMGWSFEDVPARAASMGGGPRKTLTVDEALELVDEAEEYGSVSVPANCSDFNMTCFCCPCCCHVLESSLENGRTYKDFNKLQSGTAPSRFRPVINPDLCNGCQTCVSRCIFDAIEMKPVPGSKKLKASIIDDVCMGCGLCVFKCPQQAMQLEVVRPPSFIPILTRQEQLNWDIPPLSKAIE